LFHAGDWIYRLIIHQACVFENQAQYKKANSILTSVIKEALKKRHIGNGLYETISQFQVQLNKKQSYLAYWVRKISHHVFQCHDSISRGIYQLSYKTQKQSKCHFNFDLMFHFNPKAFNVLSNRQTLGTILAGL
jgi:hypothetical protein